MMRFVIFLALSAGLSACMTTREEPVAQAPVADTHGAIVAAQLASELDYRARYDPAALEAVDNEMRALALRLAAPAEPPPEPDPIAADPDGGISLMHAVHLASYRDEANAVSGWMMLQGLFPDLFGDRMARIEEADLGSRGLFLRLKAGPFDTAADARLACREVEATGGWCAVTDFTGRPLEP
ncbi:hypothetical protein V0U79_02145 [Hyphobacterium sp. HN65]|uniref:SPOR domain-containing protein n=1 Tax=Hyphobacterium lacteum TaxID=3116575 RepID=A0ABU7LMK3_9PROT|nr:hypothetical protein [Hyphobacterium sp. HN65]MEE2525150.1 hypothetical protein [Hyphobacterium sp. HN65]